MPRTDAERLSALAGLWLAEPMASGIEVEAGEFGLPAASASSPAASAAELAEAFVELFVLGVPPYASVFTERNAELNGSLSAWLDTRFRTRAFVMPPGLAVAARDHLGLWLLYLSSVGHSDSEVWQALLEWAPVCCHAVEVEPGAHPFYVAMARETRDMLGHLATATERSAGTPDLDRPIPVDDLNDLDDLPDRLRDSEAEVGFPDVVRFFLAPARCGVYLSRSWWGRTGRTLGLAAPFGTRFEVAAALLRQAGETARADLVLDAVDRTLVDWDGVYAGWAEAGHWSRVSARTWRARVGVGRAVVAAMGDQLQAKH